MLELTTPVQYVKGIGPKFGGGSRNQGHCHRPGDLLNYLPFRYEDRLNPRGIAELRPGEMATGHRGSSRNSGLFRTRRMPIFQLTVGQGRFRLNAYGSTPLTFKDKIQAWRTDRAIREGRAGIKAASCRSFQPQFLRCLAPPAAEDADDKAAASLEVAASCYLRIGRAKAA